MANTRSQVIARDFKCARNYLTLLEKAEADSDTRPNKTEEEQKIQGLIHEAFSLAAVVAYIRPFTPAHRLTGRRNEPWIDEAKVFADRPELKKSHKVLADMRHNTWAHTGEEHFEPNLIKSIARDSIPVFRNLIDEVEQLLKVTDGAQK
jgi:hypothetical protein